MTARNARRRNRIFALIGAFCALIAGVGIYLGVAQPWKTEAKPAKVGCANRTPVRMGETCTSTDREGQITTKRQYTAINAETGDKSLVFGKEILTITVTEPTFDNFCTAVAIAKETPDRSLVAANRSIAAACTEIRALSASPADRNRYFPECDIKAHDLLNGATNNPYRKIKLPQYDALTVMGFCDEPLFDSNAVSHA